MKRYSKLNSTASIPAVFTGGWLAKQTPERQLTALVAVAVNQSALSRLTHKQLAAIAGISEHKFREIRRLVGAPIRAKQASVRKADPAAAPTPVNTSPATVAKSISARDVADLVAALRELGSKFLLDLAAVAENDEHIAAHQLNGNGQHRIAAAAPH